MAVSLEDREQFAELVKAFSKHVESDYVKAHLQNALKSFSAETEKLSQERQRLLEETDPR